MLKITLPSVELYDEVNDLFITSKEQVLQLEHSLVSLSKWESKWKKPFLTKEIKTTAETIDYIKCMTITQNMDDAVYNNVTDDNISEVQKYIESPMTATTIANMDKASKEIVTAEIIYYWMITLAIPFEPCHKWHLDKLTTLINVCSIKNAPPKKMSRNEVISRNAALNRSRRKAMRTSG